MNDIDSYIQETCYIRDLKLSDKVIYNCFCDFVGEVIDIIKSKKYKNHLVIKVKCKDIEYIDSKPKSQQVIRLKDKK